MPWLFSYLYLSILVDTIYDSPHHRLKINHLLFIHIQYNINQLMNLVLLLQPHFYLFE